VTADVATEQSRFEARELVIGGPMFGSKTFAAKGLAAEREAMVLASNNLSEANFDRSGKWLTGTRRHVQVYLDELTATIEPDGVRMVFTLPAGSYATVLLREVMKANVEGEELGNAE
jgi:tRNA pseudouridine13 synthase